MIITKYGPDPPGIDKANLRFAEAFNQAYPGLETIIHGAEARTDGDKCRLHVNCLREERPQVPVR